MSAANVNAARFEIALKLFAVPLFARLGAAHGAAAPVRGAEESILSRCCAYEQIRAGFLLPPMITGWPIFR